MGRELQFAASCCTLFMHVALLNAQQQRIQRSSAGLGGARQVRRDPPTPAASSPLQHGSSESASTSLWAPRHDSCSSLSAHLFHVNGRTLRGDEWIDDQQGNIHSMSITLRSLGSDMAPSLLRPGHARLTIHARVTAVTKTAGTCSLQDSMLTWHSLMPRYCPCDFAHPML